MKRVLAFLKDYKKECVLAPGFKLLEAVFELFVPLVIAGIIDRGIPTKDMAYIGKMGLLLLLLAIIGLTVAICAQFFAARAAVGVSAKLRQAVFDHIQSLDFTSIDQVGTSTLITRMTNDINQVQSGVNMVLRLFLRSPIIVFGAMIMAFTIDVKSALIFAVAIPLLAVVVYGIMFITMPMYKRVQGALDKVLGITKENLNGVRVIRAFHQEEQEEARFKENNQLLTKLQMAVGRVSALTNPVTYVIVNGAICYLIYIGAIQVNLGILTQGQVVAIINYMSQILVELVKLANLIVTLTKAMACADRVGSVLAMENEEIKASDYQSSLSDGAFITVKNASLTYKGAGDATLKGINLNVEKGQTIGIIGGTGSGKSSLIHLIAGFYPAIEGGVFIDGKNVAEMELQALREMFGIVPQNAVLFKGTIRENLLWGNPSATEEELWRAIDLAQAREVVEGKEGQLDAAVEQNGRNFSGGQRQRLTIARALVRKPEVLILDDSASALDYATDAKLRQAIRSIEGEMTTFIVSQRPSTLRHADQILVLEDGEMAGIGTHEELLACCEEYQEIYYSQYPDERPVSDLLKKEVAN